MTGFRWAVIRVLVLPVVIFVAIALAFWILCDWSQDKLGDYWDIKPREPDD